MLRRYPRHKSYRYVQIEGGLYLCLRQNPLALPWLIYSKGKALRLSPKNFVEALISLRRLLGWGQRLTQYALPVYGKPSTLELPFFGHLCLDVHAGYKVFDLSRETVTKIFKPDVDSASVRIEIERARTAGRYDFAPRIRGWNVEERWYEEDYVNGNPITSYTHGYPVSSSDSSLFLDTYYHYIAPCVERLILSRQAQIINVNEYFKELLSIISKKISKYRTSTSGVFQIDQFIDSTAKQLNAYADRQIYIVLSHGDFGNNHVIDSQYGLKVIDWEYMSYRSILFDLYSCFLEQLFFKHRVSDIVNQVNDAILTLQNSLADKVPITADDLLHSSHIYRWVFYIEQICSHMEFPGLNIKPKLLWIDAFTRFEKMHTYNDEKT